MIDDIPIGTGLSRDIATGEKVEGEIDAMISRRHDRRVLEEGERPAQEMWAASVRRYNMRRGLLPRLLAAARTKKLELELRRVEEKLVPAQEASAQAWEAKEALHEQMRGLQERVDEAQAKWGGCHNQVVLLERRQTELRRQLSRSVRNLEEEQRV